METVPTVGVVHQRYGRHIRRYESEEFGSNFDKWSSGTGTDRRRKGREVNDMKWDVKHDRAKKVLNHFLDNAGYWTETESLTEGLTEDEIQEVSAEVATMIQSITKRYKLDVMLPAEPVVKEEPVSEEKAEEPVAEEPAEEAKEEKPVEKPKRRGRKPKKEEVA